MNEPLLATVELEQPIATDLPAFDGHFPGSPVLPGAHLVALVLQAIGQRAAWAQRDDTPASIVFSVRCGATPIARGTLARAT
jgi:3-hydroxymyristoyl/3-hydroxydecanoyl-(acyl carrier protein) dehydratase